MSILLLVVVLLVVAIVLSRLTWASLGERRSIQHHEQAMDVLRSVAGRPLGPEHAEVGADSSAHVKSSVDDGSGFPAPAPPTRETARAVPEATVQREETIRILRAEPTGEAAPPPPPPAAGPTEPAPPAAQPIGSEAADEPVGVEARQAWAGSAPSWEPAHPLGSPSEADPSEGDGETARPAFVFIADDTGRAGPVTVPPSVADAVRSSARGRWGNGDGHGNGHRGETPGWGDGRRTTGGNGWADGERWAGEPGNGPTTLPRPPAIGDQDWSASTRSEARSRSRARTRSRVWGRVLAPVHATGRVASGARGRLGSGRRAVPPAADTGPPDDGWITAVRDEPTGEGVKVMTAEAPAVTSAPGPAVETTEGGGGRADTTAPGPAVPAGPPPPVPAGDRAADGFDTGEIPPFDSGQAEQPGSPLVKRAGRGPRFGLAAGLAAIVVVACVVAGVLIATMSSSSNTARQSRQAAPPASAAPAPPPSPLKLLSHDDQGALYSINASRVSVSAVASGRVWIEVVSGTGPFGQVLWQGILTQGQSQTITNNAPVWVRIGAASNVTVSVNGGGVLLPQSPTTYNLTFSQA